MIAIPRSYVVGLCAAGAAAAVWLMFFTTTRAGFPIATQYAGMSFATLFTPMIAPSPMVTPFMMKLLCPIGVAADAHRLHFLRTRRDSSAMRSMASRGCASVSMKRTPEATLMSSSSTISLLTRKTTLWPR